jgi:phage FluMu protein Com
MPLRIRCTRCEVWLRVPQSSAGKRIKCPKCKTPVDVPRPKDPAAEEAADQAALDALHDLEQKEPIPAAQTASRASDPASVRQQGTLGLASPSPPKMPAPSSRTTPAFVPALDSRRSMTRLVLACFLSGGGWFFFSTLMLSLLGLNPGFFFLLSPLFFVAWFLVHPGGTAPSWVGSDGTKLMLRIDHFALWFFTALPLTGVMVLSSHGLRLLGPQQDKLEGIAAGSFLVVIMGTFANVLLLEGRKAGIALAWVLLVGSVLVQIIRIVLGMENIQSARGQRTLALDSIFLGFPELILFLLVLYWLAYDYFYLRAVLEAQKTIKQSDGQLLKRVQEQERRRE